MFRGETGSCRAEVMIHCHMQAKSEGNVLYLIGTRSPGLRIAHFPTGELAGAEPRADSFLFVPKLSALLFFQESGLRDGCPTIHSLSREDQEPRKAE
ncbi:hypothetical protein chiPu_0025532, partial [Chiloscyllium punctatum]|nr:hypothetical protein [Chiloscyllium punctatum]